MRCVRCNRPLTVPAATVGIYAYGPKCAKVAGQQLIKAASQRKAKAEPVRDRATVDWVEEVMT